MVCLVPSPSRPRARTVSSDQGLPEPAVPPSPPRARSAMKRFIVPDDSVAPNVGNSETTNEPAVVRSPEGHRPHQRDPLLHPLHDPVERVEAAGRSPEGTNPRLQAPVKTISTQTPASSWTQPTRTTLMGRGGPTGSITYQSVSVHCRSQILRAVIRQPGFGAVDLWFRPRVTGTSLFPWTGALFPILPDLL